MAQGHKLALWVRFPLDEMKYLIFSSLSFINVRSYHSTRNTSRFRWKMRNGSVLMLHFNVLHIHKKNQINCEIKKNTKYYYKYLTKKIFICYTY